MKLASLEEVDSVNEPGVERIERLLRSPTVFFGALAGIGLLVVAVLALALPLYQGLLSSQFSFSVILMAVVLFILLNATAICILAERKVSAYIQDRQGPNRVGPLGLLQPIADGLKMFIKEHVLPANVDRPLYLLAPALALGIALLGFAIIPWAGVIRWPWMSAAARPLSTQVASLDVGFLYLIAVASMGVYGVVLAGYASNNKYAFYGGMRAAAQMISYEIPLGLGLLCILLTAGTLRLEDVVNAQARSGLWYVLYQPLAFLLVLISGFAETNRAPFDLAEAEQELVGGYHTEYSALRFGMFFLGEYAHMITNSALMIALFFGGWAPLPFLSWYSAGPDGAIEPTWWNVGWTAGLIKFGVYWGKIALFIAFYMVVRWTLPRFRFDQLMRVAWQALVPMGVGLVLATAVLVAAGWQQNVFACLAANVLVLSLSLLWALRSHSPVTGRQENLPEIEVRPT
jgi:NADH-quinone oxidoreductase subunit H